MPHSFIMLRNWARGRVTFSAAFERSLSSKPTLPLPPRSCRFPSMAKSNYGETTSLSPLPPYLHRGLISVSSLGLISFVCSTSLFLYLTYRFISWTLDRRNRRSVYRTNQFLVLIYNLLLADIQQSLAFSLNISAVTHNAINVDMPTCWAQGWFLSTGMLGTRLLLQSRWTNYSREKATWLVVSGSSQ